MSMKRKRRKKVTAGAEGPTRAAVADPQAVAGTAMTTTQTTPGKPTVNFLLIKYVRENLS